MDEFNLIIRRAWLNSSIIDKHYFFQYFDWEKFQDKIIDSTQGGAMKNLVGMDVFRKTKVAFPKSLEEQSAIATALSETDELIQQLGKLITKKKDIKKGAMQELLTGKKRLPGFSGEWEDKALSQVVDFMKGAGLSKTKISTGGKNKCLLYGELFTTYKEVIREIISKTDYNEGTLSKSGDILMPGSTTTVGIDLAVASAILEDNVYLGGDVNILRKKEDLNSEFLANYLTHVKKYEIAEITQGTTIIHLYGRSLKNIQITIPPSKQERSAIANILADMDSEIEELERRRDKYLMVKEGMMQQLLTGRIRLDIPKNGKILPKNGNV
jgi:type I restriction enzyme S subunit